MNTNDTPVHNEDIVNHPPKDDQHSSITNLAGVAIVIGFLVVIGITIFKNFSEQQINKETIRFRQGELLDVLKTSNNELETQKAVQEYDSLNRMLDIMESK